MASSKEKEKTPYEEEVEDSEESEEINRDAGDSGDDAVSEQAGTEEEEEEDAVAVAEKKRLKEQAARKAELLKKMHAEEETAAGAAGAGAARRDRNRLAFLARQAELFQHFAPGAYADAGGGGGGGAAGGSAAAAGGKKGKGGGGKKKGRHAHDEDDEDAELLRDEDDGGERAGHRLQVQPSCLSGGTLREYQMQGLNWLIHLYDTGINGILADEMGLGKTLQTISLLAYLREFRKIRGPHLIIVPKSTLGNWMNEIRRFCPVIQAVRFHGNAEQREAIRASMSPASKPPFDCVVTSYEMVIKEKAFFRRYHWRYVIIDEAHRIKNENSVLSRVVRLMKTDYRLLITGTPLQNNLHELWALLNFLLPEVFSSSEKFEEWFGATGAEPAAGAGAAGGSGGGAAAAAGAEEDAEAKSAREAEVVSQLHKVLRPFLLRRLKADVERGLPPKKETILKIGMSEMQRTWYKALLQKDVAAIDGSADRSRLLNVVMQLRKCCNHPYLFQGAEPGPPFLPGDHLVENSGKMVLLDKLLPRLQERGSRVLIFSQMTRMLDVMEDYCLYRGYKYCRIDGNTGGEEREAAIDGFNAPGSEQFVFLLSTRAGGLGINLATADVVVLYDSDWNPQMDLQAMDRAHRIGQKKEVQVFRFCTEHSIEEKVIEKAYKKLRLDALVIQQGRLADGNKASAAKVNKDDLLSMVRYGAELVFSSEAASITDADIEAILTKGERETALLNEKMQQFTDKAAKVLALDGGMSAYDFKDPEAEEEKEKEKESAAVIKAAMAENWADPGERKRKRPQGVYNEADYFRQAGVTKGGVVGGHGGGGGGGGKGGGGKGGGGVKVPTMLDFQFFDERIKVLYSKENEYLARKPDADLQAARAKEAALLRGEDEAAADEQAAAARAAALDGHVPLTEDEYDERRRLQAEGFGSWSRKDFNNFVRACERHGRGNLAAVSADVEGKAPAEVERYARAFWSRLGSLADGERERVLKSIEKGEQRIQRQADVMAAIRRKLRAYRDPWQELRLAYGQSKGRAFTEEEDRFLLCTVDALGYGQWEELKAAIRLHWRFRFDWFFKSRTPTELARRCDVLVRLIERENEEAAAAGGGGAAGGAAGGGARKSVAFDGGAGAGGVGGASEEPEAGGGGKRSRPGSAAPGGKAEAVAA